MRDLAVPSCGWDDVDARRVAAIATAVFCIGNLATALLMPGFVALLALRALTALGGGTLMVLCMTSAATSGNRDRVYGLWVVGQLVAGALGLFVLPHLFDAFGLRASVRGAGRARADRVAAHAWLRSGIGWG